MDNHVTLAPEAQAHCDRGNCLYAEGQFKQALESFKQAVQLKPDYAEALCNLGSSYGSLGQYDLAIDYFQRAQTADPNYIKAFNNCAVALGFLNRHQEALDQYSKVLALNPNHINAWFNRGLHFACLNEAADAAFCYEKCLALDPLHIGAHCSFGALLSAQGKYQESIQYYSKAITLKPSYFEALINRGSAYTELGRHKEALDDFLRARELQPNSDKVYFNIANTRNVLNQSELAIESYDRAVALNSTFVDAINNRANVLLNLHRYEQAIADMEFTVSIKPDPNVLFNIGFYNLLLGNFSRGFEFHEHRITAPATKEFADKIERPFWDGTTSIKDKNIALIAEQGFGDTIQFCRYAKCFVNLGAHVTLLVPASLVNIISTLSNQVKVISSFSQQNKFDYKILLLSAPYLLKTDSTSIPAATRYLHSSSDKIIAWNKRLTPKTRPRVGLVWSGNAEFKKDKSRSIPLENYIRMLPEGFDYICLQKEIRAEDKEIMQQAGFIQDVSQLLHDFSDTAALCETVDLVISTCTSVAHLSAALGRPTWILLSTKADWRWLLERKDSPWYPTARLFRQIEDDDWTHPFEQVKAALNSLVSMSKESVFTDA